MIGFTAVVVSGLFIELYRPVMDFIRTCNAWELLNSIGMAVVTLGVGGELFIDFKAHRKQARLREMNAAIDADATKNLKSADERIAQSQKDAAEANERAKQYEGGIAEAAARAAEAERGAAVANLALAKMKEPRTLTQEQQQRIMFKIGRHRKGQKWFLWVSQAQEAIDLANMIAQLLTACGWELVPSKNTITLGPATPWPGAGIEIRYARAEVQILAYILAKAIKDEGIEAAAAVFSDVDQELRDQPDAFIVAVGSKPM